jgi:FG-GAP-like repeat
MRHRFISFGLVATTCLGAAASADSAPQKAFPKFTVHDIGRAGRQNGQTSLADIDRDGDLDFVSGSNSGEIRWWENQGGRKWARHRIGDKSPTDVGGVAFDADGDGWVDQCSGAAWFRNTGKPREGPFERFDNGAISTHDNRAADVDGDGRPDLLAMGEKAGVWWYKVPADATKKWEGTRVGDARHSGLSAGDIDGDKDLDIVVGNWWYENKDGRGRQWAKHENIPFEGIRYNQYGMAPQTKLGDIDADGDLDVAITDGENARAKAAWMENADGKGRKWVAHMLGENRGALHSLAIADFDLDGDLDVFSCEMEIGGGGNWFVWENLDGKAKTFREHTILSGVPGHETVAGDVDGDGDTDLCSKPWNGDRHVFVENLLRPGAATR